MKDKKNIDRLFQEKFKDFEGFPKEKVWKNIKHELKTRKKRRLAALPLWSKIAGIAALIAILLLVGQNFIFNTANVSVATSPEKDSMEKSAETPHRQTEESVANAEKNEPVVENGTTSPAGANTATKKTNPSSGNGNGEKTSKTNEAIAFGKNDKMGKENAAEKDEGNFKTRLPQDRNNAEGNLAKNSPENKKGTSQSSKNPLNEDKDQISAKENVAKTGLANSHGKKKEPVNGLNENYKDNAENQNLSNKNASSNSLAKNAKNPQKTEEVKKLAGDNDQGTSKDKRSPQKENIAKSDNPLGNEAEDYDKSDVAHTQNPPGTDSLDKAEKKGKRSLLDAIAQKENDEDTPTENEEKFALRPNVSPIYYSSLNGGSAVDPKFSDNKTKGEITMAYGIDVSYALSERLKIRSGISKVNMSYNTNGIAFTSSPQAKSLKGLRKNVQTQNLSVSSKEQRPQPSTLREVKGSPIDPYTSGQLNQQFGFIEVPLEIEYALLDQRFAINLIGGASTLFLNDNSIQINSSRGTTTLGKASNLNSVSFTTNIGLGFGYDVTKKLNFNLEPTFKYQLNAFSGDTGGFQPYYFGVYTGFTFKF